MGRRARVGTVGDRRHDLSQWVRFGGFEVDLRTGELTRQGRRLHLTDKPFQVLISLLERPGELVTREELRRRLWSDDTFVDFDNNLNAAVSRLREALNDSAQGPRFVETIPRKGYRFVGPPPVWDSPDSAGSSTETVGRQRPWVTILAILGAAVLATAALVWIRSEPEGKPLDPPTPPIRREMLAVLPFENLSDDPRNDYLADGLTEELLTQLGATAPERLGVIARTSVRRYKKTEKSIEEIGGELGVDFVVEGSVRVEGERLRVSAQLIRVSDQTHLWAESYEDGTADLLEIQRTIAERVTTAILPKLLLADPEQAANAQPQGLEALKEYLQGLGHLGETDAEASFRAERRLERAIALDPSHARSWAALAMAQNYNWFAAESSDERKRISEQARSTARKALELDPSLAEGHVALAFSHLYHDWNAPGATEVLDPVLERSRNSAEAHRLAAAALSALRRHDEALVEAAEVLVLDPASPRSGAALGWHYLFAGRWADAETTCREVLEHSAEHSRAGECLYQALLRTGKEAEAVVVLGRSLIREGVPQERFQELDPEDPPHAIPELERIRLEHIFSQRQEDPAAAFDAATAFARLGEIDRTFAALEMALEERDTRLLYLAVDPRFEALRDDHRFGEMLVRTAPR